MNTKFVVLAVSAFFLVAFSSVDTTTETITWYELKEAQQLAKQNNKKVLIYAEAVWCTYCQKMEKEVFPLSKVIDTMAEYYYPVRLDIESDKEHQFNGEVLTGSQFARKYRVQGTPTTFFIDANGKILGAQPGFIPPDTFENLLRFVGTDAYQDRSFDEYMEENEQD